MMFGATALGSAAILLLGMLLLGEAGRQLAVRRAEHDSEGTWRGIGVVDGAVFGLLGLMVAFTFSGAASRFDARRYLIVEESNAISTAYLRLDLLPKERTLALRDGFRRYLDTRIQAYRGFPDRPAVERKLHEATELQAMIWKEALASAGSSHPAAILLPPALNRMFDIATTRSAVLLAHPPMVIFVMLFGLSLISSLLAGYGMARSRSRHWLHALGFAAVTSLVFYVILDMEFPRLGLVSVAGFDDALVDLRRSMD